MKGEGLFKGHFKGQIVPSELGPCFEHGDQESIGDRVARGPRPHRGTHPPHARHDQRHLRQTFRLAEDSFLCIDI